MLGQALKEGLYSKVDYVTCIMQAVGHGCSCVGWLFTYTPSMDDLQGRACHCCCCRLCLYLHILRSDIALLAITHSARSLSLPLFALRGVSQSWDGQLIRWSNCLIDCGNKLYTVRITSSNATPCTLSGEKIETHQRTNTATSLTKPKPKSSHLAYQCEMTLHKDTH